MNNFKISYLKKSVCLTLISIAFTLFADAQTIRYVKTIATGSGNGSSWNNASDNIQAMINASDANDEVWVKGGTYLPSEIAGDGTTDRDKAFVLKAGVKVYGGFAGTETALNERDLSLIANESILSGDLNGDDGADYTNYDENAYHVVIIAGDVGNVVLNGFAIKGGNANTSGTITVNSKSISKSNGGGIYNFNDAFATAPLLSNLNILSNRANSNGGGIYNNLTSPSVLNVSIKGNYANSGGGIYNNASGAIISNSIIAGNRANTGGALFFINSNPVLTNVTISGNKASIGGAIYNSDVGIKIRNSIIYGNSYGVFNGMYVTLTNSYSNIQTSGTSSVSSDIQVIDGGNNLNTDPLFVDAPDFSTAPFIGGDYRLKSNSPSIEAGNNTFFNTGQNPNLSSIQTDLTGNARINITDIDMGAYEYLIKPDANGVVYVSATGSGDFTGDSWANATDNIQFAIDATAVQQVWVKGGTYIPSEIAGDGTTDRHKAFILKENVKVYGGFAGTETTLNQRDLTVTANKSILSGDFSGDDGADFSNHTENAYHVVIATGAVATAELNGFTIQGGNANTGSNTITVNGESILASRGGGVYNVNSSPLLTNLSISSNQALFGGGVRNDNSNPILTNVSISGNLAANNGGGINNDSSNPIVTNVIISGNAATNGAGLYNNNGSNPILTNVTISGNAASTNGGAMYNNNSSAPVIRNSISYGNSSEIYNASSIPVISYSLIQTSGGSMAWSSSTGADGGNNLDIDPSFVNAPLASTAPFIGGDYHLTDGSYAIGSGDNTFFSSLQTPDLSSIITDIEGNERIQKTFVDMGSFESNYYVTIVPDGNGIVYVSPTGSGNLNGSSWANATDNIQLAINHPATQQVWVKGGTYTPSIIAGGGILERDKAFVIFKNIQVYGGFAGTETTLNERDLSLSSNESILSGDLNGDDGPNFANYDDNVYHVIVTTGSGSTALLDGFTIRGGNANGNSITSFYSAQVRRYAGGGISNYRVGMKFNKLLIKENITIGEGGGLYLFYSVLITNTVINGNSGYEGAGIFINDSHTEASYLTNTIISGNIASRNGGGIELKGGVQTYLTNVTVSGNKSGQDGGALFSTNGQFFIRNSVIYKNSPRTVTLSSITSNSIIEGSNGSGPSWNRLNGNNAGNNLDADPLFINAPAPSTAPFTGGDYHLQAGSPAIGSGDNTYFNVGQTPDLSSITTDLGGNTRQNGMIDMGVYEFAVKPDADGVVYVTPTGSGDFTGNSWENATNNIQFAVDAPATQQVWVKGGTYIPTIKAGNGTRDRDKAFVLKNNVKVYGGFAGTETDFSQRNLSLTANESVLSGDLNGDDEPGFININDNAYHVVLAPANLGSAALDGFTIKAGYTANEFSFVNASGSGFVRHSGAGLYNQNSGSSFTLSNITFQENRCDTGYGGALRNENSTTKITHVHFINNFSYYGGAVYNYSSNVILSQATFVGNKAFEMGGGIYNEFSSPTISNVLFSGNQSLLKGGAVYNEKSSPIFTNNTFSGNNAPNGGALFNNNESSPKIRNSIIFGNSSSAENNLSSSPIYNYSIIEGSGGSSAWVNTLGTDAGNNLDASPLFLNAPDFNTAPFTGGDYHIQSSSPAINAGLDTYFNIGQLPDLSTITTDLDGNLRIQGGMINMGVYENFTALPVNLISFKVSPSGKYAKLNWQTASENNNNNNYFTTLKSQDGKTFEQLTTVKSKGNNGGDYQTIDFAPFEGTSYYKLSQTDIGGKTKDLGIRTLKMESLDKEGLYVYPNPVVNGIVNIQATGLDGLQTLTIYDFSGKTVLKDKTTFTNGIASYKISDNLRKDTYILQIGSSQLSNKLIIQ